MNRDDDFRVRPGRIRSRAGQRARPFIFQALAAAQRAGGRKRTKSFRQSFLAAYAHRVGTRLAAAAETPVTADLLPVLASREVAVTAATDRLFPRTTTTRLRGITDEAGWTEGAEAADRAQVHSRPHLP